MPWESVSDSSRIPDIRPRASGRRPSSLRPSRSRSARPPCEAIAGLTLDSRTSIADDASGPSMPSARMSAGTPGLISSGVGAFGIHEHQSPAAFAGELESTAAQTIDALGRHDDASRRRRCRSRRPRARRRDPRSRGRRRSRRRACRSPRRRAPTSRSALRRSSASSTTLRASSVRVSTSNVSTVVMSQV